MTLRLAAVVQRPTSCGIAQSNLQSTLQDGDRTVGLPLPMFHYGSSGVVAVPTATLSGSVVSLDLEHWNLYDLEANRTVGLWFRHPDPGAPDMIRLVDRYVREARHLAGDDLQAWVGELVGDPGDERGVDR